MTSPFAVQVSHRLDDPEWDTFLESCPNGHHVQTSLWAAIKAWQGWRVIRIVVTDAKRIVGGAQVLLRKARFVGTVGYVPRGPVVSDDVPGISDLLSHKLLEIVASESVQVLFVQPPDEQTQVSLNLRSLGFRPSPIETAPTATVLINLTSDLDTILARMKKGMRNSVRQGERRGIVVREGTEDDIPTFHRLLTNTAQRRGFSPFAEEYFTQMWRVLNPHGYIKLFLAEFEGTAVSAQIGIAFGTTFVAKQIGWSGEFRQRRPNEAMDWATIQWAKSHGYTHYDLEGIDLEAAIALRREEPLPESLANSPTAYKVRFGGQVKIMPEAYCYISNKALRAAYNRGGFWLAKQPFVQNAVSRFRAS